MFALGVELPALRRLQAMEPRPASDRGRRLGEALAQGGMLAAQRDQRRDPRRLASLDIGRAEVAGVGQQGLGLAQVRGQGGK